MINISNVSPILGYLLWFVTSFRQLYILYYFSLSNIQRNCITYVVNSFVCIIFVDLKCIVTFNFNSLRNAIACFVNYSFVKVLV